MEPKGIIMLYSAIFNQGNDEIKIKQKLNN